MADNQKLRKLTQGEQKQLHNLIQKSTNNKNVISAQQSIPYIHMYSDGLCHIKDNLYSKCIRFGELNYLLAGQEEQQEIFGNWCGLFNQIDSSISVQISFYNQNLRDITLDTLFPLKNNMYQKIGDEYWASIRKEIQNESNAYNKEKYLTYTIYAENPKAARMRFAHMEQEFLNQFEMLGVSANVVTGYERLEIMHGIFHPQKEQFWLSWEYLTATGLTTKDVIAPSSFTFKDNRYFQIGDTYGAASFVQILAPELSDRLLSDILHSEQNILVSLHIKSINQIDAIRQVKRKISDLDKMKIEEQKRAVRSGYDMEILPSDLATYGMDAKNLLQDLQNRNERMFLLTFLVVNFADSKEMLENIILTLSGIVQKHNCMLTRLDYQQEEGFMSCLPLGYNQIAITRNMTISSTAILIPFTTQELIQKQKAVYYGVNAISQNPITCDRLQLKNPNGIILGTPGAGKSFAAKREIIHVFLTTDDDIIVCDPESEYSMLTEQLQGQVIRLSHATTQFINPMDINLNYSDDDNPLALKSDFILSLCELILGNKGGLEPIEKSVIDRSVRSLYQRYLQNPIPENMPLLEDLYKALLNQPEPESKRIASALELYVYLDSIGMRAIKFRLEQAGRLTSMGKTNWHESNISKILQNSFYCGIITYHKEYTPNYLEQRKIRNFGEIEFTKVKGTHEPIVTEEEFERVQAMMAKRRQNISNSSYEQRKPKGLKPPSDVWTDILICECGHKFNRKVWHRLENDVQYGYQCYSSIRSGTVATRERKGLPTEGVCKTPMIAGWKLQMMAKHIFNQYLKNTVEVLTLAMSMLEKHIDDRDEQADNSRIIEQKSNELEKLNKRLGNLIEMRADGEITRDVFKSKKEEIENRIRQLQSELEQLQPQEEPEDDACHEDKIRVLKYYLEQSVTPDDSRDIPEDVIRAFIVKIVVHEHGYDWYLRFNPDEPPTSITVDGKRKSSAKVSSLCSPQHRT